MSQSKIHVRYAKALFSIARKQGEIDRVRQDMELILKIFSENDNFTVVFSNPSFRGAFREKFFKQVFGDQLCERTYSFIELLLDNKRELFLPGMARRFLFLYKKEKGILTVTMTSAVQLSTETIEHIRKRIASLHSCEVEMECLINPDLIGGFLLRIDDRLMDASIRGELKKIQEELQNGSVTLRS
jgi:F-type H+-transporting ATPase subunit delta